MGSVLETLATAEAAGHRVVSVIVELDGRIPIRTRLLAEACTSLDLLAVADAAIDEVAKEARTLVASPQPDAATLARVHLQAVTLAMEGIEEASGTLAALLRHKGGA